MHNDYKDFFRLQMKRNHTGFTDYTCVGITPEITPLKSMDYSNETIIQLHNLYININWEIKASIHKTGTAWTKRKGTESFGSRFTVNWLYLYGRPGCTF